MENSFNNIAGYEAEKKQLQNLCELLKNEKRFSKKGAKMPKGLILYGETGTGKTLFARVLAAECNFPFVNVTLSGSDNWQENCSRLKNAYEAAKTSGKRTVIFIGGIDKAIPDDTQGYALPPEKRVLNQLITLIDEDKNGNAFFIATCDHYYTIPYSLVKTGRMDKKIRIRLPDHASRLAIADYYIAKTDCSFELNSEKIADLCALFSGAEMEKLINECAASANDDHFVPKQLIFTKLKEICLENIREGAEYFNTRQQAAHSVGHFIVAQTLQPSSYILCGKSYFMGNDDFFSMSYDYYDKDDEDYGDYEDLCDLCEDYDEDEEYEDYENYVETYTSSYECGKEPLYFKGYSRKNYMNLFPVLYGGYVAENLFFNTEYQTCADDFRRMDRAFYKMCSYGMLGHEYYFDLDGVHSEEFLERLLSKKNELFNVALKRAQSILQANFPLAEYLVLLLLRNKIIYDEELDPLIKTFLEEHK